MSKYKCNQKLSKKETNKSNKKFMAKLAAGLVAVAAIANFTYSDIQDHITHDNIVKNNKLEYSVENGNYAGPVFESFMKDNKDKFKEIRRDLSRYKRLLDDKNRSPSIEREMKDLIIKINKNYSNDIKSLALNTVKSKLADAHNLNDLSDINISVNNIESYILVKNKKNDNNLNMFDNNSNMQISKTIFSLAELQNTENPSSYLELKQRANLLYRLYNNTLKTANKNYHNQVLDNGDKVLTEIPVISNIKSKSDDERSI